jgi:DeoR/GlpR family transcriptional regulator of sugar metabolism
MMSQEATPEERHKFIMETLEAKGRLGTSELSEHFQISEDTARRDLREMASAGLVQRVHGGALPVSPAGLPFVKRYRIANEEKARIARSAMRLISPGQMIIMDGGTSNLELARLLPRNLSATIITNSPRIATETSEHPLLQVILLGGVFDKRSQMTLGAHVLGELASVKADLCFLGVHGIHPEVGLTTTGFDEATIKKAMMAASAEVIALVTQSKFGTAAAYKFADLSDLDVVVAEDTALTRQFSRQVGRHTTLVFA